MSDVLLTNVCRPFGDNGEGDSVGAELFHAQVTRSQGIFSYRQVIRCWGLDYIAENIEAPTVVLHYPSKREFRGEIRKRFYGIIGINLFVAAFHKVQQGYTPFLPAFIAPKGGTNARICSKRSSRNPSCNLVRTQSATQSGIQAISRWVVPTARAFSQRVSCLIL